MRINDSIFTSCSVVGSLYNRIYYTHLHVDKNDIILTVFVFGDVENGGDSIFYDGLSHKEPGDFVHVKQFKHGMSITGDFSSILHGASSWNGQRLAIVFFLNKQILKHFSLFKDFITNIIVIQFWAVACQEAMLIISTASVELERKGRKRS